MVERLPLANHSLPTLKENIKKIKTERTCWYEAKPKEINKSSIELNVVEYMSVNLQLYQTLRQRE